MSRLAGVAVALAAAGVGALGMAWWSRPATSPSPSPSARPAVPATTIGSYGTRVSYPAGREPSLPAPDGTPLLVHSLLRVDRPMHFGDYVWNESGVPAGGDTRIRVDLSRQLMSVFRGGHEIGTAVILYGTDHKPTPTGTFPILARARLHQSTLYDAEMPYMLRLTNDGVAIHASAVRRGYATHGCVGIPEDFARRVFTASARGDLVTITA
ncbi:L,D-transpeptidase family protein [Sphingomonas sp. BK069]|uniref:L,D-transpeptidase family protein n=1 Tax=Sphingomonas sp. BK069 TaxID=2586979 RepID=UPI0017E26C34|nr:L,D-transpeptidase family protein [Sphingomonas sp. BK069]MBB3349307.1 lipoprotein-anchoring transpeptidase ErfK/SrfK [Sphingomonas sp. BK069]